MLVNKILSDCRSDGTIPTLIPILVNKILSHCSLQVPWDDPDPDSDVR